MSKTSIAILFFIMFTCAHVFSQNPLIIELSGYSISLSEEQQNKIVPEIRLLCPWIPNDANINIKLVATIDYQGNGKKSEFYDPVLIQLLSKYGIVMTDELKTKILSDLRKEHSISQEDTKIKVDYSLQIAILYNKDKVFVDDPNFVGQWNVFDFVSGYIIYNPNVKQWKKEWGEFRYKSITIKPGGDAEYSLSDGYKYQMSWTNGYTMSRDDVSRYVIKEIDRKYYLFLEWGNGFGSYSINGLKPNYYVFQKQ